MIDTENGESPREAVLRETVEELGIMKEKIHIKQHLGYLVANMGATIDVFPTEPVSKDEPLLKLDNITVTNHQGGATVESYVKAPEMVLDMLKHSLE